MRYGGERGSAVMKKEFIVSKAPKLQGTWERVQTLTGGLRMFEQSFS